jgi:NADH:ubiquinone oxidoreductase subunit
LPLKVTARIQQPFDNLSTDGACRIVAFHFAEVDNVSAGPTSGFSGVSAFEYIPLVSDRVRWMISSRDAVVRPFGRRRIGHDRQVSIAAIYVFDRSGELARRGTSGGKRRSYRQCVAATRYLLYRGSGGNVRCAPMFIGWLNGHTRTPPSVRATQQMAFHDENGEKSECNNTDLRPRGCVMTNTMQSPNMIRRPVSN